MTSQGNIELPEQRFVQLSKREKECCENLERLVMCLFDTWLIFNREATKETVDKKELEAWMNFQLERHGFMLDGKYAKINFTSYGDVYYFGYFGSSFHFTDIDKILKRTDP